MSRIKSQKQCEEQKLLSELFEVVHNFSNSSELEKFFADLCTPSELRSMADRWRVARLLDDGIPYRKINELTGVSTATVTRVARSLDYGSDGYKLALERLVAGKEKSPVSGAGNIEGEYRGN
jgi:TrpR-related protein YerC/YecD